MIRISTAIAFLQMVQQSEGDIEIDTVNGFVARHEPSTGEMKVHILVGDGEGTLLSELVN